MEGDGGTKDATFTQADIDAAVAEANTGLEANRNEVLGDLRKAKDALKVFDGLDAKAARDALAELREIRENVAAGDKGATSEQLKTIRAENLASIEEKYAPIRTDNETLRTRVRTLELDNVIKSKMGKSGVKANRIDALFRLEKDAFDLTDEGEPILKGKEGQDIDKYISDVLSLEYPEFYESSGSSGGGASKSLSNAKGKTRTVAASDKSGLSANVEDIAKGTVTVEI